MIRIISLVLQSSSREELRSNCIFQDSPPCLLTKARFRGRENRIVQQSQDHYKSCSLVPSISRRKMYFYYFRFAIQLGYVEYFNAPFFDYTIRSSRDEIFEKRALHSEFFSRTSPSRRKVIKHIARHGMKANARTEPS